jgi:hypothetical protein
MSVGAGLQVREEARQYFPALHNLLLCTPSLKIEEFIKPVFERLLKVDLFTSYAK